MRKIVSIVLIFSMSLITLGEEIAKQEDEKTVIKFERNTHEKDIFVDDNICLI